MNTLKTRKYAPRDTQETNIVKRRASPMFYTNCAADTAACWVCNMTYCSCFDTYTRTIHNAKACKRLLSMLHERQTWRKKRRNQERYRFSKISLVSDICGRLLSGIPGIFPSRHNSPGAGGFPFQMLTSSCPVEITSKMFFRRNCNLASRTPFFSWIDTHNGGVLR